MCQKRSNINVSTIIWTVKKKEFFVEEGLGPLTSDYITNKIKEDPWEERDRDGLIP